MLSPFDLLPIWNQLQEASIALDSVHCLHPTAKRIERWPQAEMHHVPTLLLCLAGSLRLTYEKDQRIDLKQHQMVIIGPGVFHQHSAIRRGCVQFQMGFIHYGSDVHFCDHHNHFIANSPAEANRRIIDTLLAQKKNGSLDHKHAMQRVLQNVLHNPLSQQQHVPPAYSKMFHYFVAHVYDGICVNDVISVSGLSRSHAYALFSKHYGAAVREALCQQRMYLAQLLMAGTLSFEDISRRCGFSSRQQMTRAFQNKHQCAPRAWREGQYNKTTKGVRDTMP